MAWLTYVTDRMLDGARLNLDLYEINSPALVWLTLPASALARLLGVPAVPVFVWGSVALAVGSLAVAGLLLRRLVSGSAWGALVAMLAYGFGAAAGEDVGQKEYVLLVLVLPYVLLAAIRADRGRIRTSSALAIGLAAGVGVALKPHFAALPLALEVWLAWRRRSPRTILRVEVVAGASVLGACGLAVVLLQPQWFRLAPLAAETYLVRAPTAYLVFAKAGSLAAIAALMAAWLTRRAASPLRTAFLIAAAAMAFVGIVQGKGFNYHYLPALVFGLLALAVTVLSMARTEMASVAAWALVVTFALTQAAFVASDSLRGDRDGERHFYAAAVAALRGHRSYAFLSFPVHAGFPTTQLSGARWALPFPSLWFIPGFYREGPVQPRGYRTPADMSPAERWFFERTVDAVVRERPDAIIVEEGPYTSGLRFPFDYLRYFQQSARFRAAFREYHEYATFGGCVLYSRAKPERPIVRHPDQECVAPFFAPVWPRRFPGPPRRLP